MSALGLSSTALISLCLFWPQSNGARQDFKWISALTIWRYWTTLDDLASKATSIISCPLWTCTAALFTFCFSIYLCRKKPSGAANERDFDYKVVQQPCLKPLLFPSRTSHMRLFPKNHSFSYSYLLVGIPVGWRGSTGSLISADLEGLHIEVRVFVSSNKDSLMSYKSQDTFIEIFCVRSMLYSSM